MSAFDRFVALDVETTGLGSSARIVELAFVLFEKGAIIETWSSLLNPGELDWEQEKVKQAMAVNKIDPLELADKPTFKDIYHRLFFYLRAADVWAAHNAEFDLRLLRQEHERVMGSPFQFRSSLVACTKLLSINLEPHATSHRLADVASRWGVVPDGAHRAVADATTCGRILQAMALKRLLPDDVGDLATLQKQANGTWRKRGGHW